MSQAKDKLQRVKPLLRAHQMEKRRQPSAPDEKLQHHHQEEAEARGTIHGRHRVEVRRRSGKNAPRRPAHLGQLPAFVSRRDQRAIHPEELSQSYMRYR